MTTVPAIGLLNPDGTATLSREEVAWLRDVFSRMRTAFGNASMSPQMAAESVVGDRTVEMARHACARYVAQEPGVCVMREPTAINAVGDPVDPGSPYALAIRHTAEITVIAGGLPPAPAQRDYFPHLRAAGVADDVAETQPLPGIGPVFGTVRTDLDR